MALDGLFGVIIIVLGLLYGRWSYRRQVDMGFFVAEPCRPPDVDGGEIADMSMYLEMGEF